MTQPYILKLYGGSDIINGYIKKISHHVHPNGCEIAYPLYTEAHSKLFVEFELGGKYIYFSDKLIGDVYKFNAIQTICISSYGGVAGFK